MRVPSLHPLRNRLHPAAREPGRGGGTPGRVARSARRDGALGAAQARYRGAQDRRVGAAGEDGAGAMGRCRGRGDRGGLARPRAALPAALRLARRAGERPEIGELPNFTPLMLSQPLEEGELDALDPAAYFAEWKWDGIRVQLVSRRGERRIYSRSGDDIGPAFSDVLAAMPEEATLDGELLVVRDGEVAPFNDLQQRLNRKTPTPKMLAEFPAAVRLYDVLRLGDEDLRPLPLSERRYRLEAWYGNAPRERLDLSPLVPFSSWAQLKELRENARANGIEGLMLKRRDFGLCVGPAEPEPSSLPAWCVQSS